MVNRSIPTAVLSACLFQLSKLRLLALSNVVESLLNTGLDNLPPALNVQIKQSIENIFRPEVQALLTPNIQKTMQEAVAQGVSRVFWITFFASLLCLILSVLIPVRTVPRPKVGG